MASLNRDSHWRSIAEQLSIETDSTRSAILVDQLCRALDERAAPAVSATIVTSPLPEPIGM
jgi:hypothetical protein